MDIYSAVVRAANHIERNPGDFDFFEIRIPHCGTPGCALGWIGHFCGYRGVGVMPVASGALHCAVEGWEATRVFYDRMDASESDWRTNAVACARALRAYAAKYLRAPQAPPDWEALAHRLSSSAPVGEVA